ncbi:MAG: ThiF family adenylyltransferase, partial [Arenimonas sp.]|nr:ThiF family adenylyltransferase [Arenimonas sp.]
MTPQQALARQAQGARLVDVREPDEHALGTPAQALRVPRALLAADPAATAPDRDTELLLICAAGVRSLAAAQELQAQGYRNVASVSGGYHARLAAGHPGDAQRPPATAPHPGAQLRLICAPGVGARPAAQALHRRGYDNVGSVAGGYQAWLAAGLPVDARRDADFMERYSRHLRLPQVGIDAQERLERARVLMVGAGGLGSPGGVYLGAAGGGVERRGG